MIEEIYTKPFTLNPTIKRFIKRMLRAEEALNFLESEFIIGSESTIVEAFLRFKDEMINLFHEWVYITETYKTKENSKLVEKMREDFRRIYLFVLGAEGYQALRDAYTDKPNLGRLRNQTSLLKQVLYSFFFETFRSTLDELKDKFPTKLVDVSLLKGGIIARLAKEEVEAIRAERL